MKLYGFLEPAQIEFDEAVNFYNHQREYLGDDFAAEVVNAINRILTYPEAWTSFPKEPGGAEPNVSRTA